MTDLPPYEPPAEMPVSIPPSKPSSPRWGATTKLIVGLTLMAIGAFLLFRFLNIVGPLLLALILAYLLYPMAENMRTGTRITWRTAVGLVYLVLLIILIGSIAIGGIAVIEQVQNLISFLNNAIVELPDTIDTLVSQPIVFGPFELDFGMLDANQLGEQVLGMVQPILTQAGSSVVSVASGAASLIGWLFFILLISYFILAESGGFPNRIISFSVPGYADDFQKLGTALGRIWNAFLRGQIIIVLMTILIYTILLGALGIKFYFGLALLAGLARFIPYVGPFVAWTSYGLVSFFQGYTIFGISPLAYAGLVVGVAWFVDMILDNYVTPRMMSNTLRVHPAAVMISALVAFNLLGVIGMVLAAPVLATVKLFLEYLFAKMFDRDPWENMDTIQPSPRIPSLLPRAQEQLDALRGRINAAFQNRAK